MSVYNGSYYLRESVESILNQSFTNFEFIIIDDGSTDDSWEILTQYAERDRRIRVIKNEQNIGLTRSLNKGIKLAQGEYIARQDADDISLAQRFEKQVLVLDQHSDVLLASCNIDVVNAEGHYLETLKRDCDPDLTSWYLLFHNRIAGHSQVMFRRVLVQELGGYNETYQYSQDYELWCRLSKVGKIAILPEILLRQRNHNKSVSAEKRSEQYAYVLEQIKLNVKQLTGEELRLEDAENLRKFWVHPAGIPLSEQQVDALNVRLRSIYQAFIQQYKHHPVDHSKLRNQIPTLIGHQFLAWANSLSLWRYPLAKVKLILCAFDWHPKGVISDRFNKLNKLQLSYKAASQ